MNEASTIVQRLWNYCHVLRDDGVSYGDYVEQLTYLLFLKMAHEQESLLGNASAISAEYSWPELLRRDGDALETHYRHTLEALGRERGLLGVIVRKAQNRIQDPAIRRDKVSLDIFWLKDYSLEDAAKLPPPHELAADIIENLESALEEFHSLQDELA